MNKAGKHSQLDNIMTIVFVIISFAFAISLYFNPELLKQALTFKMLVILLPMIMAVLLFLYRELNKFQDLRTTSASEKKLKNLVNKLDNCKSKIIRNMIFLCCTFLLFAFVVIVPNLIVSDSFLIKTISVISPSILIFSLANAMHIGLITIIDRIKIDDMVQIYIIKKERNKNKASQLKQARSDFPLEKDNLNRFLEFHS